jgi:hypothetical protein
MRKNLLLTAALAAGLFATAQTHQHDYFNLPIDSKHLAFLNSLLQSKQTAAQKPTGMAQRVIAQTNTQPGFSDSIHFKYTGSRGSRYNHNFIGIGYNIQFGSNYDPMPDDAFQHEPLDMLADSISCYEDNDMYFSSSAFYRPDNKLDSFFTNYYEFSDHEKTVHSFYPSGYIKEIVTLDYNGTSYDTFMVRKFSYNNSFDRIITDTSLADLGSGSMQPYATLVRHYNTQGNIDTIITTNGPSLEIYSKTIFEYTSSEKLEKLHFYFVNQATGEFYLREKDSFAYANDIDYFTFWEGSQFDENGVMEQGTKMAKYPGTNGLPDSAITVNFYNGNWQSPIRHYYTYNDFDNPIAIRFAINSIHGIRFHYETYEDGNSSIDPIANNKDFNVYPNPFSSNINIDWKGKQQSNVTIRLTNIVGQEVYKTSTKLTTGKNSVSIPSLNSGNYILLIQDADGKSWSSKMVKK